MPTGAGFHASAGDKSWPPSLVFRQSLSCGHLRLGDLNEKRMVIATDSGSLVVEGGAFRIKAADGTTVAGAPLTCRLDDFEFPIAVEIKDRTATLTPQLDVEHAVYKPTALPFESQAPWKTEYEREQAAGPE